ncbi:helix-turn-helix transcriptional regulator [Alkalimarinus alittae]|uniref:AraC family transcriptional regulator n=1 Tax=Alkalimarinus alittae TaxID=2961619 RepID=A0ABY6MZQ1_9ALTE|nr:AraC family transcriptional regulator [Alkalimarinus alittae]UZE95331.1 AraC family transcriptional regulator [Alkalimarinus alittae]
MKIQESVFDTLGRSNAHLLAQHTINKHFKTAHWSNSDDHVSYHADRTHTLSFYLQGGEGARRIDASQKVGHSGSLCMLPQHHQSQWEITAPCVFAHFYFSDESIKQFASTTLDIDPRTIEVPELTFHDDAILLSLSRQLFLVPTINGHLPPSQLAQEQTIQLIFKHLLSDKHYYPQKQLKLTGGISPATLRQLKEYIHQHSHQAVCLTDLAGLANLSHYHLLRMFKASTGYTPNDYLTYIRLEKSKQALSSQKSLAEIAVEQGFSNQSHFNRIFKKWVGVTPGTYRSMCR